MDHTKCVYGSVHAGRVRTAGGWVGYGLERREHHGAARLVTCCGSQDVRDAVFLQAFG